MSPHKAMTKAEYEALADFRYTLRRFLNFSESAVDSVGLTPQQHQALLAIQGFPGRTHITVGELSERLQIKPHSAVGLVNRLEAENLISRSAALDDRRKVEISLTRHGLSILEKLSTTHREELHRLTPHLRQLLERVTDLSEGES